MTSCARSYSDKPVTTNLHTFFCMFHIGNITKNFCAIAMCFFNYFLWITKTGNIKRHLALYTNSQVILVQWIGLLYNEVNAKTAGLPLLLQQCQVQVVDDVFQRSLFPVI